MRSSPARQRRQRYEKDLRTDERAEVFRYRQNAAVSEKVPRHDGLDGRTRGVRQRDRYRHAAPAALCAQPFRRARNARHNSALYFDLCLRDPLYRRDQLFLGAQRAVAGGQAGQESAQRRLRASADAVLLLFQPEQHRLYPFARHVRHLAYRRPFFLDDHRQRLAGCLRHWRCRRHADRKRAPRASGAHDPAAAGRALLNLPEEARAHQPGDPRDQLEDHRQLQRGYYRREDG